MTDTRTPLRAIGEYVPMVDGPEKVTGAAKFTADFNAPGTLSGRIFRSPSSHAEIIAVDVSAARQLPGVMAVVTGEDCDETFGVLPIAMHEFPLARERVRYRGEPIAAVAAVDDATAEQALGLIKLELEARLAWGAITRVASPVAYSEPNLESRWSARQSWPAYRPPKCFRPSPSIRRSSCGPPHRRS